jgi:hypothetical protein
MQTHAGDEQLIADITSDGHYVDRVLSFAERLDSLELQARSQCIDNGITERRLRKLEKPGIGARLLRYIMHTQAKSQGACRRWIRTRKANARGSRQGHSAGTREH